MCENGINVLEYTEHIVSCVFRLKLECVLLCEECLCNYLRDHWNLSGSAERLSSLPHLQVNERINGIYPVRL